MRDYWDKAYYKSDLIWVHMKSLIACSNFRDIASGEGNGDAAAQQQASTLEKTASSAKSNHIMFLMQCLSSFCLFVAPSTGSNGHEFMFLLKGHEDLRQDERVMQLFGLVNTLLANDPASLRKNLR